MCPKPNNTVSSLSRKSHVEIFSDPIPALFAALMSEPDTQQRWITFTFPVDFYMDPYRPKLEKEFKYWTRKSLFSIEWSCVKMATSGTGFCQLCTFSHLHLIQMFHMLSMKNAIFWDVMPCSSVSTDVSQEHSVSIIRLTRIGELGTTLAVTSNRSMLRRNTINVRFEVFTAVTISSQHTSVAGYC
jgi:hypothetical protein